MSKDELLETSYTSAYEAMHALQQFLQDVDNSYTDDSRSNYQDLKVIGNRIFN